MSDPRSFKIVGHRGFPELYPENSLTGLEKAAELGADAVEFDVQMSADQVPMVFHDETLDRVTDASGSFFDYSSEQLSKISCHEPARFGDSYFPEPIATLETVCRALGTYDCHVFVELKIQSLNHFGRDAMLQQVLQCVRPIASRVSLISFDYNVLLKAKKLGVKSVGWVLSEYDEESLKKAQELEPEFLISDIKKLSGDQCVWPGSWRWFVYDVVDAELAEHCVARGIDYIETWNLAALK